MPLIYKLMTVKTGTGVNISSYYYFFSCAEIFKLGCFVQKYSDLGVSCRNTIPQYTVRKVYTRKSNPNGPLNKGIGDAGSTADFRML